jgi:hypothetical protein
VFPGGEDLVVSVVLMKALYMLIVLLMVLLGYHVRHYNADGVQLGCSRSQAGGFYVVTGDGSPFLTRCDRDGVVYVLDAVG